MVFLHLCLKGCWGTQMGKSWSKLVKSFDWRFAGQRHKKDKQQLNAQEAFFYVDSSRGGEPSHECCMWFLPKRPWISCWQKEDKKTSNQESRCLTSHASHHDVWLLTDYSGPALSLYVLAAWGWPLCPVLWLLYQLWTIRTTCKGMLLDLGCDYPHFTVFSPFLSFLLPAFPSSSL